MTVVKALPRNNESEIDISLGVTFKLDNDESQLPCFTVFFFLYVSTLKSMSVRVLFRMYKDR